MENKGIGPYLNSSWERNERRESSLFKAMTTGNTRTENGMVTNSTSSSYLLDMFFKMGASRYMSELDIRRMFERAFGENPTYALKALFYNRDIRGGQGERRSFRIMFSYLAHNLPDIAKTLVPFVPEYGRWDDLLVTCYETKVWDTVADFILNALKSGNKLCAKWMPRTNKAGKRFAYALIKSWNTDVVTYNSLLVNNTDVVETLMCKNDWTKINYNHTPSKASHKYRDAFLRHDENRYREWLGNLSKVDASGKPLAKVNAGAIFPHDIIKPLLMRDHRQSATDAMVEAQWKAQPEYSPEGTRILPVCDVSGSMTWNDSLPLLVSVALGIYLSERNKGIFENSFITFSRTPSLVTFTGNSLTDKIRQFNIASIAENTNLEAVFKLILDSAVRARLPEEDMPDTILILSDMQFDQCIENKSQSATQMVRSLYNRYGYTVPNVIFWNLRTASGIPVKYDEIGTAVVSGFSPSVLKSILSGEIDPIKQMLAVLDSERYSQIK